jgi:hypothetical protein
MHLKRRSKALILRDAFAGRTSAFSCIALASRMEVNATRIASALSVKMSK